MNRTQCPPRSVCSFLRGRAGSRCAVARDVCNLFCSSVRHTASARRVRWLRAGQASDSFPLICRPAISSNCKFWAIATAFRRSTSFVATNLRAHLARRLTAAARFSIAAFVAFLSKSLAASTISSSRLTPLRAPDADIPTTPGCVQHSRQQLASTAENREALFIGICRRLSMLTRRSPRLTKTPNSDFRRSSSPANFLLLPRDFALSRGASDDRPECRRRSRDCLARVFHAFGRPFAYAVRHRASVRVRTASCSIPTLKAAGPPTLSTGLSFSS